MSLQLWLPLNKGIKNYGLGNISLTNNGALLSNEGIFDKCYTFGNNKTISGVIDINAAPISVSLWLNLESFHGTWNYLFSLNNNSGYADQCIALCLESESIICFCVGGNANLKYTNSSSLVGKWTHIAITFNGSKICGYINGSLVCSSNSTANLKRSNLTIGCRNGEASYYTNCKINDVRVYDNCISEYDVKRIYDCKLMDIVATSHDDGLFYDNSGLIINDLVSTAITYSGNSMYFNGTTSIIKTPSKGLSISGGTLSVWFFPPVKPSVSNVIYLDATSKMSIGLYNNGTQIITSCSGNYSGKYSAENVNYGQWNNIIAVYSTGKTVSLFLLNGNVLTTSDQDYWTENSQKLFIGGRETYSTPFKGYISEVAIYRNQFTEYEAKKLYEMGAMTSILPDEYIRLKYIQSTGTQYIDTGIILSTNKVKYDISFEMMTASSSFCPFGTEYNNGSSNVRWGGLFYGYNKSALYIGTQPHGGKWAFTTNKKYNLSLSIDNDSFSTSLNNETKTGNFTGTIINDLNVPVQIFGLCRILNNGNIQHACYTSSTKMKLYHFILIENDVMKFYGIPSKRKSDNVLGLYDLVTNTFFTNAGTGTFTEGPEF